MAHVRNFRDNEEALLDDARARAPLTFMGTRPAFGVPLPVIAAEMRVQEWIVTESERVFRRLSDGRWPEDHTVAPITERVHGPLVRIVENAEGSVAARLHPEIEPVVEAMRRESAMSARIAEGRRVLAAVERDPKSACGVL